MGEVVNLRLARKAKARADKQDKAADNRIRFGQSKQERQQIKALRNLDEKRLDGHIRRKDPDVK